MRFSLLSAAAFGLVLVAAMLLCGSGRVQGRAPGEAGGIKGILTGRVTLWPGSPVAKPGASGKARPAAGVKIRILGLGGVEITTVTSDREGHYRVELLPGRYRLEMAPGGPGRFTKDLPGEVTIAPGLETRRDIRVDTGIR